MRPETHGEPRVPMTPQKIGTWSFVVRRVDNDHAITLGGRMCVLGKGASREEAKSNCMAEFSKRTGIPVEEMRIRGDGSAEDIPAMEINMEREMRLEQPCPVCERPMVPGPSVTDHHLIPKSKGGRVAEPCHKICHGKIHATWDENQIRDAYNTWEKIREAPEMQTFIAWVRKKPPEFTDSTRMRNGHKRRKKR